MSNYCACYNFDSVASVGHSPAWSYSSVIDFSSYLMWNWATAYTKKKNKLWILTWASGLQWCPLLIQHNAPKHCQSHEHMPTNISPAVTVHISCRYGTINSPFTQLAILRYSTILLNVWCKSESFMQRKNQLYGTCVCITVMSRMLEVYQEGKRMVAVDMQWHLSLRILE